MVIIEEKRNKQVKPSVLMTRIKQVTAMLLALLIILSGNGAAAQAQAAEDPAPVIETTIYEISKYGNIVLSISPDSMRELGYEPADLILVQIGDAEMEMPIGTGYSDADSGEPICCYKFSASKGVEEVVLAINGGNLTEVMGIAEYEKIEEAPGFIWHPLRGLEQPVTVTISMVQKQGYAEEYQMHQLGGTRSNKRSDYAQLSDEEYANFRAVETTGMGVGTLYRSSSPVRPAYNRNAEADAALQNALICTVMNMADSEEAMKSYPDYILTAYAHCDIIALDMKVDFASEEFRAGLADGFRYLASHEGPYLIHCQEGKDRTGFACAVLECLMGADTDEVVEDYMITYYNFYGIGPDSEQYARIADSNIKRSLRDAFGVDAIDGAAVDLANEAEEYLLEIGMSGEEIATLKTQLAKDYGGLAEAA